MTLTTWKARKRPLLVDGVYSPRLVISLRGKGAQFRHELVESGSVDKHILRSQYQKEFNDGALFFLNIMEECRNTTRATKERETT